MNDLELLKKSIDNLNTALLQVYQMETIASYELECKIEKAIEEANRLIESGEI